MGSETLVGIRGDSSESQGLERFVSLSDSADN